MSRLSRDVSIAVAIAAGILVSLVLARLLTTDPTPAADQTAHTPSAASAWPAPLSTKPSTQATTPSTSTLSSGGAAPAAAPPAASMVLSSGVQVVPRPGRPPQSYRPAPTGLPTTPPQPPPVTPDPAVYTDPAALGTTWLTAMCWYDYRTGQDENTHRAAAYGDTSMPAGANPWVLDDQAWTRITAAHLGSGCTDIVATPAHTGHDGTDLDTVTLTATQILMVDGTPYQAVPISLTRTLRRGPDGQRLIGPAVTAN